MPAGADETPRAEPGAASGRAEASARRQRRAERQQQPERAIKRKPFLTHGHPDAHLPDFVIIGTPKGGTSSLYAMLAEHPAVGPTLKRELQFFSNRFDEGQRWYESHFPMRNQDRLQGESSTSYLFHSAAPPRLKSVLPEAKLIALLRNPIDRAYSHYQMNVRRGLEPLDFAAAVAAEPDPVAMATEHSDQLSQYASYLARGVYAPQLRRWLAEFDPSQLLVIQSERFFQDTAMVLAEVQTFLGLAPVALPADLVRNAGSYASRVEPAVRVQLARFFAPLNQQVYDLVGANYGWDQAALSASDHADAASDPVALTAHTPPAAAPAAGVELDDASALSAKTAPPRSGPAGQAPGFLIIGAHRAGTTSLFRYLMAHPALGGPTMRQSLFFTQAFVRGEEWYLSHFPPPGEFALTGEAAATYFSHPEAPGRVQALLPETKLIVLLRNPIDRAYSHYRVQQKSRGLEGFAEEVEHEIARADRRAGSHRRRREGPETGLGRNPGKLTYLARGHYAEHLSAWREAIDPARILVLRSEDFFANPAATVREVLTFLDQPEVLPASFAVHAAGPVRPPIDPALRRRLAAYFAPHNDRLAAMLDRDFGWDPAPDGTA